MTTFDALVTAAAPPTGGVDITACLVLADHLSDFGDERGDRLRKRARKCEAELAAWFAKTAGWEERGYVRAGYCEWSAVLTIANPFLCYFHRLMSTSSGKPVTTVLRVNQTYIYVQPGANDE